MPYLTPIEAEDAATWAKLQDVPVARSINADCVASGCALAEWVKEHAKAEQERLRGKRRLAYREQRQVKAKPVKRRAKG